MKSVGLALSGGGARGIAHIAFLKVFDDLGITPSIISGTSMGAIIGTLYASGMTGREIEGIFTKRGIAHYAKLIDFTWHKKSGLLKGNKIIDEFTSIIACKRFDELKIPTRVVATDFWNRREVIFQEGNIADAVRASMSIPGIFSPFVHNDILLIDGGAINPVPFDIIRKDCDILVAIDTSEENIHHKEPHMKPSTFEYVVNTYYIMQSAIADNKRKGNRIEIYIKASPKNIRILDFHKAKEIMQDVREKAEDFKIQLKGLCQ